MKISGIILIILGIVGAVFIYLYDLIIKHEPTVTLGPRSGPALGVAILVLIIGIILLASMRPPQQS